MNTRHIALATLIALAGTSSFAAEGSDSPTGVSTLSRAQVTAQIAVARAAGTQFAGGEGGNANVAPVASLRSRDEVRAEARSTRGSVAHLYIGA